MAPRSITEIINVQALKWENRRRASQEPTPSHNQQPVITISSEYGSYGQRIGEMVAQHLGFDLFDRELIDRVVKSANASRRLVESLDNRVQDWISEYITVQFRMQHFSNADFLRHLSRVVLSMGYHGRAVIMGRGAQFILDPKLTLRVRTIAPLPVRIANLAHSERRTEAEAASEISRKTSERTAFCRVHFDRDVSDPYHYDLSINTATLPVEVCADVIVHAYRIRFGR